MMRRGYLRITVTKSPKHLSVSRHFHLGWQLSSHFQTCWHFARQSSDHWRNVCSIWRILNFLEQFAFILLGRRSSSINTLSSCLTFFSRFSKKCNSAPILFLPKEDQKRVCANDYTKYFHQYHSVEKQEFYSHSLPNVFWNVKGSEFWFWWNFAFC